MMRLTTLTKATEILLIVLVLALDVRSAAADVPSHVTASQSSEDLSLGSVTIVWTDSVEAGIAQTILNQANSAFHGKLRHQLLESGFETILSTLTNVGYRNALLEPQDFSVDESRLSFTLVITAHARHRIGGWEFTGLSRTDTTWLSDLLHLPTGEYWSADLERMIRNQINSIDYLSISGPIEQLSESDTTTIVRIPLQERSLASVGGLLSAGGGPSNTGLLGRLSLAMRGLFHRGRSANILFERPRPDESSLNVELAEYGVFGRTIHWRLAFEEWDRLDHRQSMEVTFGYRIRRLTNLRVDASAKLARLTPGRSNHAAARVRGFAFGLGHGIPFQAGFVPEHSQTAWRTQWTLSRSTSVVDNSHADPVPSDNRQRVEPSLEQWTILSSHWQWHVAALGRWWVNGTTLRNGDEWFLGGSQWLRGYEERSITAESGWLASSEIVFQPIKSLAVSSFFEYAQLRSFTLETESVHLTPYCYGAALLLSNRQRAARLELAWRDRRTWRDGLVRLTVLQGW